MGCIRHRKKQTHEFTDLQWSYISLNDFKAKGCGPGFFYGWLWFSLLLSTAVYAVDSFTAVNLLAFNTWSSKIQPAIPLSVSKWIFSGCIIASFVNIGFEGIRAIRVMRRGNVAECYMDSLAARWESIRFGSGQGWRRFLVFTELTKSKKGAEYIALFTYFSFQSWIRVILCSGPRQVVNAFTLRSVYEAKLNPTSTSVEGSITGFFDKIKALAMEDYQQAAILSGMLFTFIVWVFSALFLLAAVLFYVLFLFHWIPRGDGGLTGYCVRKVNKRLTRIVTTKVNRALAKGQAKREFAQEVWTAKSGSEKSQLERSATIPTIPHVNSLPEMPGLSRTASDMTMSTLDSHSGLLHHTRAMPSRPTTPSSAYSARAPLVGSAAQMGYSAPMDFGSLERTASQRSLGSQQSLGPSRQGYGARPPFGRPSPLTRPQDAYSNGRQSPAPSMASNMTGSTYSLPRPPGAGPFYQPPRTPAPQQRGPPYYVQRSMTPQGPPNGPYGYQ
ncbi:hypothetical protein CDD80_120 [Ophiocordyceps camponoti-rufipedis]|uniref:Pheromone-regulated membrane protein n=1 Tax=Ophiocordyceps camponoti-rufipedis TaxID=2004952 RepID=A0A2C5ZDI7_9HYPO|nr:hypothetical protein CDD80_120 [Ophiocordyceps camponoti-rufipedis]